MTPAYIEVVWAQELRDIILLPSNVSLASPVPDAGPKMHAVNRKIIDIRGRVNDTSEAQPVAEKYPGEDVQMEILWFILIGLAAGWLAGQFMRGGGFGIVGDIIVGVIGALIGGFLFRTLGISPGGGLLGGLVVATVGSVVLLFLLRLIRKA